MSVQFILGRSGTGKTTFCIKGVVDALLADDANVPLILLVPEQATYQAECAILADKRISGYNRLNILSFDRLRFLLSGKNAARPSLSRIGRQMIIHKILREQEKKLKVFGSSANQPGLGRQMADTISEMLKYAKEPGDVAELVEQLRKDEGNNLTALKFADISLIFEKYLKFIDTGFIDPDRQIASTCRQLSETSFAKGARLWVDGFAGFTSSEFAILTELLKVCCDAQIALCLDVSDIDLRNPCCPDSTSLFYPTEQTYVRLCEIIKKCKLQLAEPAILDRPIRFSSSATFTHIERNIFKIEPVKSNREDNVRIICACDSRAEVGFIAGEILRLVKEKNLRYRDIAVIASDIDRYEHYIKAYFDDYGIPFFLDRRKKLNQYPVVRLISSALKAVAGDFSASDIFAYLKSGLVPIGDDDIDELENYCLAFGITAKDWQSGNEWHYRDEKDSYFDESRVNQIRLKAIEPLLRLREELGLENPATMLSSEKFTKIIFDFLDSLDITETITGWVEQSVESGDSAAAREHQQFYEKLLDIFDEFGEIFSGREQAGSDFIAIIESAFLQMELAFIPPTLDQVLVGSIERSRHPDLKAVFLTGATQKQFPVPVSFDNILTDMDRCVAESADFSIAATTNQTLSQRQYLAYIAFTRASEFLYVTYPAADEKGSAVPRSGFISNLKSLFENLEAESIADDKKDIDSLCSESDLSQLLSSGLGGDRRRSQGADGKRLEGLLDAICSDTQFSKLGSKVLSAINYDNSAKLEETVTIELFGKEMSSSATALGTFAQCPYQYFARYIMELGERQEFKLRPLDVGDFYHRVLDGLSKELISSGKNFATVEDNELLELLRKQILMLVQSDAFISHFKAHSSHNAFIINSAAEVLEDCVLAIGQMVHAGNFVPVLSEVSFGQKGYGYGEYKIKLSDGRGLCLCGKIDRLDMAEIDGQETGIVFDYKRKGKAFNWSHFYYGLDLQLPIYMLAVRNAEKPSTAAGAFYMPVEINPTNISPDELVGKTDGLKYKAKGLFNGEFALQLDSKAEAGWNRYYNFYTSKKNSQYGNYSVSGALRPADFEKVLRFTEKKIAGLAEEILAGKIDIKPYRLNNQSPCSFCKYKPLCRFDWQINEYNYLESVRKTVVLERAGALDG